MEKVFTKVKNWNICIGGNEAINRSIKSEEKIYQSHMNRIYY
jgi:hypothetical protein